MRVRIKRASDWQRLSCPYEGAESYEYTTPFGHRRRDWYIDIDTLDDLFSIMENVDFSIVLHRPFEEGDLYTIVIYDDYIE